MDNAKLKGMSRKDVARKSGVSINAIERWLLRKNEPSIHLLAAVINTCGYQLKITLGDL